ncbi:988_t:CDS:2 [Paraglomus brasilianum]|uniref:Orotidine 5'-phosphate decarboxylase n=1 Tax=Paraglomus brasilianum TaxID=144538 RepID=A0A9N9D2D6_9GLOM|nr:988_t:CDS:2 [Paraglomus brasilianum]
MAKTYAERVENFQNETARKLLQCIERKKSNLCVAVDVTRKTELLDIVDKVGPYVCLLKDFVIGFVAGRKLTGDDEDFVVMSPGVGLDVSGDALGQRYRTPEDVIVSSGSDIIIVGRGIYGKGRDVVEEAKRYRDAGWKAYMTRLGR